MNIAKLNKESRQAIRRYQALEQEYKWHRSPDGWVYADGVEVYRVTGPTRDHLTRARQKAYRDAVACLNAAKGEV